MAVLNYKSMLGIQVSTATVVIPQTVVSPGTVYFTIAGGLVLITGIIGVFTVSVGSAIASPARSNSAARFTAAANRTGVCVDRISAVTRYS